VKETIDKLETFDVFIGLRLHSVIFSYCATTPAVLIEYRPKARDFMQSIGMDDFNVRTDAFTAEKGRHLVETLYAGLEGVRQKASARCRDYREGLFRERDAVLEILR
jgi:polysaccharide pyruvyl transferase WcaK-like protein